MRDMMLRPDVYAQAEEQLKVLLADITNEVKNGMDVNTATKAAYEKIQRQAFRAHCAQVLLAVEIVHRVPHEH